MMKSDFALFLQWLEGDCPCPCVCMSAVPGAAQTQAFLSVVRTPRAHRSQGTLFFPRKRSRRSAAAQPRLPSREQPCSTASGAGAILAAGSGSRSGAQGLDTGPAAGQWEGAAIFPVRPGRARGYQISVLGVFNGEKTKLE